MEVETKKIKCPACEVSIDGDYWPCSVCSDTGEVEPEKAQAWLDNINYYYYMLRNNSIVE
jgi:hypothetical protein